MRRLLILMSFLAFSGAARAEDCSTSYWTPIEYDLFVSYHPAPITYDQAIKEVCYYETGSVDIGTWYVSKYFDEFQHSKLGACLQVHPDVDALVWSNEDLPCGAERCLYDLRTKALTPAADPNALHPALCDEQ